MLNNDIVDGHKRSFLSNYLLTDLYHLPNYLHPCYCWALLFDCGEPSNRDFHFTPELEITTFSNVKTKMIAVLVTRNIVRVKSARQPVKEKMYYLFRTKSQTNVDTWNNRNKQPLDNYQFLYCKTVFIPRKSDVQICMFFCHCCYKGHDRKDGSWWCCLFFARNVYKKTEEKRCILAFQLCVQLVDK